VLPEPHCLLSQHALAALAVVAAAADLLKLMVMQMEQVRTIVKARQQQHLRVAAHKGRRRSGTEQCHVTALAAAS
jgi:hypothetical protein